jgi:ATP-dependent Clp protease adaptor protein ClpS
LAALGGGIFIPALVGWLAHARLVRRRVIDLGVLLDTAANEALRRQHEIVTPEHLLWTLLAIPELARALERRCDLAGMVAALDARLKKLPVRAIPSRQCTWSVEFLAIARSALGQNGRARGSTFREPVAPALLRCILDANGGFAHELLLQSGLRPGTALPISEPATFALRPRVRSVPGASPYRRASSPTPPVKVAFWNDDRTPFQFVIDVLTNVFALSETRSTYLTFTVHNHGRAVVWSGPRREAEHLADHATRMARDLGFPLRIEVEPSAWTSDDDDLRTE